MRKRIFIDDIETRYEVSEDGRVFNIQTGRELKGTIDRNEYRTFYLIVNGVQKCIMGHRLVAEAFLNNEDPEKKIIHHKDGNPLNNKASNLEWVSYSENNKRQNQKNRNYKERQTDWIDKKAERKDIPGFENYIINTSGEIFNKSRNIFLCLSDRNGYKRCDLKKENGEIKRFSIHRLIYETFIGPIPQGMVIDHIDGDKSNNELSNLRCISQSENAINAQKNGHKGQHKVAQYDIINNFIKEFPSFTAAAKEMGVSYAAISSAAKRNGTSCGYKWKEI